MPAPDLPPSVDPFTQVPETQPAAQEPEKPKRVWMGASAEAKAKGAEVRAARLVEKKRRSASVANAMKARERKNYRRSIIKEKVKKGIPITEEEANELAVRNKKLLALCKTIPQNQAESAIILKPHTINALRLIVEQTAAEHGYNPIAGLLEELKDPDLSAKDRVAIHKTLLPFLMPQIAPAKEEHVEPPKQASKITIKSFQLAPEQGRPIHETKKDSLADAVEREEERTTPEAEKLAYEPDTDTSAL